MWNWFAKSHPQLGAPGRMAACRPRLLLLARRAAGGSAPVGEEWAGQRHALRGGLFAKAEMRTVDRWGELSATEADFVAASLELRRQEAKKTASRSRKESGPKHWPSLWKAEPRLSARPKHATALAQSHGLVSTAREIGPLSAGNRQGAASGPGCAGPGRSCARSRIDAGRRRPTRRGPSATCWGTAARVSASPTPMAAGLSLPRSMET